MGSEKSKEEAEDIPFHSIISHVKYSFIISHANIDYHRVGAELYSVCDCIVSLESV